ncbi:hypothetical protein PC121_g15393 [Phytophthora cactorum]|nr:hypothetical protein PC120_g14175 [Phytophthora cactorum]KAG3056238.1 hypothetical protein PC121_g15393 [Phytophthora cactorum]KAG4046035.1 hypothetical protein PC123_g18581 [Phytophthora cactorum]
MKMLTKQRPQLGEIVVFGAPCTLYRDPRNNKFSYRAQQGMIIGIGEETKGHRFYLPKDKVVITMNHAKTTENRDKTQNEQFQRLYLQEDSVEADEEHRSEDTSSTEAGGAGSAEATSGGRKSAKRRSKKSKKKTWTRERRLTKLVGHNDADGGDESAQQEEPGRQEETGQTSSTTSLKWTLRTTEGLCVAGSSRSG